MADLTLCNRDRTMKPRKVIAESVHWAFAHYPVPKYPVMRKLPEQVHYLAAQLARDAAIKAFQAGWKAARDPKLTAVPQEPPHG